MTLEDGRPPIVARGQRLREMQWPGHEGPDGSL